MNELESNADAAPAAGRRAMDCTLQNCTTLAGLRFGTPNTTNLHTHGLHVR